MAAWTFASGDWRYLPNTHLSDITGRAVIWRLVGGHEASFTIDGTLPEAADIQELISDLWVYRNSVPLYRGRFGSSSDTLDGTTHAVGFNTSDYRAVLKRRLLFDADTRSYPSTDLGTVGWNLITQTQAKAGGDLGITRGLGQVTGITGSPAFSAGASVGDMLDQIGQGSPGFDFDISPVPGSTGLTFDIWTPQRGTDRQQVLDYPGRIASLSRQVDPGNFANALRVTGGNPPGSSTSLAPVAVTEANIGADPAGRFETQFGDTTVVTAATLTAKANHELALQQYVQPVYTVTLTANSWDGPADIWLGDPITLVVNSGRLNVVASLRVFEVRLTLDDASDAETVVLTLGAPASDRRWLLRNVNKRLTSLETR